MYPEQCRQTGLYPVFHRTKVIEHDLEDINMTYRNRPGPSERHEIRELENLLIAGKTEEAVRRAKELRETREKAAADYAQRAPHLR